ncbi:hypothetical protein HYT18_05030 [Candidatus Microgenomates bacterium]|nr:hypothetical protein [Candidatus Microgenomates bacterium]
MAHPKDQYTIKVKFLLAIVVLGLIAFFLLSSTAPFKNTTLKSLFPKQFSRASQIDKAPKVNLRIAGRDIISDRVINVSKDDFPITLIWTTAQTPQGCIGRSFGLTATDESWAGPKDVGGGSFTIQKLDVNNPYVYTIDCSNAEGEADGSSVTINVGAQNLTNAPYFPSFDLILNDKQFPSTQVLDARVGDGLTVSWNSLNTATPYSICISSGSWPKGYKSIKNFKSQEKLTITAEKIYKYTIYCSNEQDFTQDTAVIIAR